MKPPVLSSIYSWAQVQASATAKAKGIDNTLPDELIVNAGRVAQMLECVQGLIGAITVSSWYRCLLLNAAVGSKPTSMHPLGLAADFIPVNLSLAVAFERIRASVLPYDQLIIESVTSGAVSWIHLGLSLTVPRREALRGQGSTGDTVSFTRVAAG